MASIAEKLAIKYGVTNPYDIMYWLDISLLIKPLSSNTLGMTIHSDNETTIFINANANEHKRIFIGAHELGHSILHPGESTTFFRTYCKGLQIPQMEAEAHQFAFNLLLYHLRESGEAYNVYSILKYYDLPYSMDRFLK